MGFYSRNLEIIHIVINTKQENEQHNFQTLAQNNYFGLSRYGRLKDVEVGRLISKINEKWKDTTSNPIKFGRKMKNQNG